LVALLLRFTLRLLLVVVGYVVVGWLNVGCCWLVCLFGWLVVRWLDVCVGWLFGCGWTWTLVVSFGCCCSGCWLRLIVVCWLRLLLALRCWVVGCCWTTFVVVLVGLPFVCLGLLLLLLPRFGWLFRRWLYVGFCTLDVAVYVTFTGRCWLVGLLRWLRYWFGCWLVAVVGWLFVERCWLLLVVVGCWFVGWFWLNLV